MKKTILMLLLTLFAAVSCASPRIPMEQRSNYYTQSPRPAPSYAPQANNPEMIVYVPPSFHRRPQPTIPFANQPIIILDPGHGGEDFGTHSLGTTKYHEKYLNMSTSFLVKNFLEQFGYKVILTRTDDTFIPLDQRAIFANEQKPTLFVSIHYNSAPSKEAEGIEVFYFQKDENKSRMTKSKQLAQSILNKTLANTDAKSRGVKHGNYAVIRQTDMPAVLIEGGFLTNSSEMEKIKNVSYQKSLALGIAQGIQEYVVKQGLVPER